MLFKKKDTNESSKAKTSLFASKAKKDEALEKESERTVAVPHADTKASKKLKTTVAGGKADPRILIRPRITEKAANESVKNVYTFDVLPSANKNQIVAAIKDTYKVTPVAVRVVTIPTKNVYNRKGATGVKNGGKKAYVQLKKGDTIELV